MNWRKFKVGEFLTERPTKYKPDQANKLNLNRIDKIDFKGNIHLGPPKATKTNMILVKKGDLVISGINAEKGAVAVYKNNEDALASSHYSSYEYNPDIIDIEFLRWLLQSNYFRKILTEQSNSGIKTEIKPKKLLSLEMEIPELEEQKEIAERLNRSNDFFSQLATNVSRNYTLVQELRQAILQEAIQGELTKEWREANPDIEPADQLLARIQKEKERLIREEQIKKEKPLPPVSEEEKPFELPEGWVWCRLPEIGRINPTNKIEDNPLASFISMPMISAKFGVKPEFEEKEWQQIKKGYTHFQENDVAVAKITPCFENSKAAVMKGLKNRIGAGTTELHILRPFNKEIIPEYVYFYFKSPHFLSNGKSKMTGSAGQKRVPKDFIKNNPFPLPPLEEQKEIVEKVKQLVAYCDELEVQVSQSQTHAEQLMEAVLQEVFEKEEIPKKDALIEE